MALLMLQEVAAKGDGAAAAAANPMGSGAGAGSSLIMFLPLVLMIGFMLFTSSRRQKKEAELRKSLRRGDKILTNAGIIGELVEIDDRFAKVKIAAGTTVQVLANTVAPFGSVDKSAELADLKEARAAEKK